MLSVLLVGVALLAGIVDRTVDRARAQGAADAVALAGAAEGSAAARRIAAANAVDIVSMTEEQGRFEVVVSLDGTLAEAHAERFVEPLGP